MSLSRKANWWNVVVRSFLIICFTVFGFRTIGFLMDSNFPFWPMFFTSMAFFNTIVEHIGLAVKDIFELSEEHDSV